MAAAKQRVVEVEGLLEGMHSSVRIHGEEADAAIAELKVSCHLQYLNGRDPGWKKAREVGHTPGEVSHKPA